MTTILTIIHVLVSLFLVAIVLLQQGKGADMGAAFGGGSSQTVFGADGPVSLLGKVTTAAAIIFMVTSLTLAYQSSHKKVSVMEDLPVAAEEQKPKEPEPQLIETKVADEPEATAAPAVVEETAVDEKEIPPAPPADLKIQQPETPAEPAEKTTQEEAGTTK